LFSLVLVHQALFGSFEFQISGVGEKKFEIYHDDFAAVLAEA